MVKKADKNKAREARHRRVRNKISGTPERPRLNVFRSSKHIYAQVIDDVNGVTLASASSLSKDFEGNGGNKDGARTVGQMIAKQAKDKGITTVVFDRGGNIYHGRIKELAESARENGLEF
jgi:large subunit ribosomal protein L18